MRKKIKKVFALEILAILILMFLTNCSGKKTNDANIELTENTSSMLVYEKINFAEEELGSPFLTSDSESEESVRLENLMFESLSDDESIGYERKDGNKNWDIEIFAVREDGYKRPLFTAYDYTGYSALAKKSNKVYFSIMGVNLVGRIFYVDGVKGTIKSIAESSGGQFVVSDDGKYICFNESWVEKEKAGRLRTRYFLLDVERNEIVDVFDLSKINSSSVTIGDKVYPKYQTRKIFFDDDERCFVITYGIDYDEYGEYKLYLPPEVNDYSIDTESKIIAGEHYSFEEFNSFSKYEIIYDIPLLDRVVRIYGKRKYIYDGEEKTPRYFQEKKLLVLFDASGKFLDCFAAYIFPGANYENTFISTDAFLMQLFYFPNYPEMPQNQVIYVDNASTEFFIYSEEYFGQQMFIDDYFVCRGNILWRSMLAYYGQDNIKKLNMQSLELTTYNGHYLNLEETNGETTAFLNILPAEDTSLLGCFQCEKKWYVINETEIVEVMEEPTHGERRRLSDFWVKTS